jgi:hypothetical protein
VRLRLGGASLVLLVLGCLGFGVACTGRSGQPDRTTGSATASCPAAVGAGFSWPPGIPADLPMPAGARLVTTQQLASGFTLVTFTTPGTVRGNLISITEALRAAGYTAGRGIVGASQSRLPFTGNGNPGVLELTALDTCTTRWRLQA